MELSRNENKGKRPRWIAKIIGANVLAASLLLPACTSTPEAMSAAPIPTAEQEIPDAVDPAPNIQNDIKPPAPVADRLTRDTGIDMQSCLEFSICGTDLGVPFLLPNGSVGYLFGDTFAVAGPYIKNLPPGGDKWRSPVMMRSNDLPEVGKPITFDNAAGLGGKGIAPEVMYDGHRNGHEVTIFPNDAISLPDGRIVMSYMSVGSEITPKQASWSSAYAGLAVSYDGGNTFDRMLGQDTIPGPGDPVWMNTGDNLDANQMWSMQRDGDYVYILTARAGRQNGPMMMLRVPWQHITEKGYYECWNGSGFGGECQPLLPESKYGEPSLRKLNDGTWAMSYVDYTYTQLVTRTAKSPTGPWSEPKVQMSWLDLNSLYGGFIHPYSTADNLVLMVSTWQREDNGTELGKLLRYDVSHLNTTL